MLDMDADTVWRQVQRPRVLTHVSRPMLLLRPVDPPEWPEAWPDGEHVVSLWLLGFMPLARQVISVSRPPPSGGARHLRDNGRVALARRWDHLVTVEPLGDRTRYIDRVEIEAGWLTPLVAAFAAVFYRHRQRRWRRLARSELRSGPVGGT